MSGKEYVFAVKTKLNVDDAQLNLTPAGGTLARAQGNSLCCGIFRFAFSNSHFPFAFFYGYILPIALSSIALATLKSARAP
jgi:hypothetical protein